MGAGNTRLNTPTVSLLLDKCPLSILDWTEDLTLAFSNCFTLVNIKEGAEISADEPNTFFIVSEGEVAVSAIMPTVSKKTGNIKEFLCKKKAGDMVFVPGVKKLISDKTAKDFRDRESGSVNAKTHKNLLNLISTLSIYSAPGAQIMLLNWDLYLNFEEKVKREKLPFDLSMLAALMKTNLVDYLLCLPFLKVVSQGKLDILASMCHYELGTNEQTICSEGEIGEMVYMILSGTVKVVATELPDHEEAALHSNGKIDSDKAGDGSVKYKPRRGSLLKKGKEGSKVISGAADQFISRGDAEASGTPIAMRKTLRKASRVKTDNGTNNQIELATLTAGNFFGEMSAYCSLPRAATVICTTPCLFATLSKADFKTFLTVVPEMEQSIELNIKQHMLQNLFQLKSPFLQSISVEKAHWMAELSTIETYDEGTRIFKQGDPADSFYFVYSGSLTVEKISDDEANSRYIVGQLYCGDYFGELALINEGNPRSASIVASSDVILLSISKENFHICFGKDQPDLLAEFIVRMNGRNVELKTLLNHNRSRLAFVAHLEKEHGLENLKFYDEVVNFEKIVTSGGMGEGNDETITMAELIVQTYVVEYSPQTVNLPSKLADAIVADVGKRNVSASTFKAGKLEVYNLMARDLFMRFKKSEGFEKLMAKLQIYDEDIALSS